MLTQRKQIESRYTRYTIELQYAYYYYTFFEINIGQLDKLELKYFIWLDTWTLGQVEQLKT